MKKITIALLVMMLIALFSGCASWKNDTIRQNMMSNDILCFNENRPEEIQKL